MNPFTPIQPLKTGIQGITGLGAPTQAPSQGDARSFGALLGNALNQANATMETAADTSKALATGSLENLHEMTIAGAKAEVMLHLTTQIASKLASATTTLFQMQI
ncbi:MAG TPA: flagellar hook-basal body complex protein FliE [Candidatus Nitrosotenuis sp.]|jgi:flagellar hook-basal body complex protein FliE|nr:flagellar hook-basal body complex protein FliE [Candidatus Nitrosotenuis sp.]